MKRQCLETGAREVQADAEPGTSATGASEPEADTTGGWSLVPTDEGSYYYYNSITGQSQWEVPFSSPPLPPPPTFPFSESAAGSSATHAADGTSAASGTDNTDGAAHGMPASGFTKTNSDSTNPRKRAPSPDGHAESSAEASAASSSSRSIEVSGWSYRWFNCTTVGNRFWYPRSLRCAYLART